MHLPGQAHRNHLSRAARHAARHAARPGRPRIPIAAALGACLAVAAAPAGELREYRSKYYTIHTDLPAERVAEVQVRIERMAEEYHKRTRKFAGRITQRLPFFIFQHAQDYHAAGGVPGSGGLFDGRKLMMIAGPPGHAGTWRLMQHEGFHQFVFAVIGGSFPAWVNEGMAEYFGDSIFTGDGYVTGVIPPERLKRLQRWISEGHTISIRDMMKMTQGMWNANLSLVNYDQAWSMIYFLAHAENSRYQRLLNDYIIDVSRGAKPMNAWKKHFGSGVRAFEQKWRQYWADMPPDATADLYAEATVAKLTSFYARAFAKRQVFREFDAFISAAQAGQLKQPTQQWLPPGLLHEALAELDAAGAWQVRKRGGYELVCTRPDGTELIGQFKIGGGLVRDGSVRVAQR